MYAYEHFASPCRLQMNMDSEFDEFTDDYSFIWMTSVCTLTLGSSIWNTLTVFLLEWISMAFRLNSPKFQLLMRKRKSLSLKTPEGLQVDPSHTKAVFRFPTPKDVRDTRYFMGRAHVPIFSAVIRLMNELLKKHTPFVWSKARVRTFKS